MKQEKILFDGFHKIIEVEAHIKEEVVKREKLVLKPAVAGIVIDEDGKIGLVTQYRPVIQQKTKEIPAGVMDKDGLSPVETLIEELMEECEIPRTDILSISETPIHEYFMMAGSSEASISIYEIHVTAQTNKTVTDSEVECVEWVTIDEMKSFLNQGWIVDGKTILAYYYLKSKFA